MDKIFDHNKYEPIVFKKWQEKRYFSKHDTSKKPFTILLPPPNVTGVLHLGHALDTYIPDTVNRFYKLNGYDVWFIAGMDHAGIATQSKVEQLLVKEGKDKHKLGREAFLKECWNWKAKYSQIMRKQWEGLGLSLDLENERFTLDDDANEAVLKVFVDLYHKGYIYQGYSPINWDCQLKTALSNIEVINEETKQDMVYIKYPVVGSKEHVTIATVRTETLFSDVAVVYHPKDKRYKHLAGKKILHPLLKTEIPIIADEYIDPAFGTGLMKLSAHATEDIAIIKKHQLAVNETINDDGVLYNANEFSGLDRLAARKAINKYLLEHNFVEKVEETISNVGYSERTKTPVEILVRKQWFVKMDKFGQDVLANLKTKFGSKFYPSRFANELKRWMLKVHDWTISRQLWWGHRIPAWYKNEEVKVQIDSPGPGWVQDEDVLDTWFSSGISSFTFLGWPQTNKHLKHYYPVNLLVTGRDLIFFWIARMYFFSLEFIGKAPFKDIMIHGLVRDENNVKMSKSLNNGIDPNDVIAKYGSDTLRWSIVSNTKAGNDLRISNKDFAIHQALINKLWNVARYIKNKKENGVDDKLHEVDKWINNKLLNLKKNIEKLLKKYEFSLIGKEVEKYIFNDFSSWYIELSKTLNNKQHSLEILKKSLLVLHPFLPFVTDAIFSEVFNESLLDFSWPVIKKFAITNHIDITIEIVTSIRKYRQNNNISNKDMIYFNFEGEIDNKTLVSIKKMANCEVMLNKDYLVALSMGNLYIKMDDSIKAQIKKDLEAQIKFYEAEIVRSTNILNNKNFMSKAPAEKIAEEKAKFEDYKQKLAQYKKELACN
ncbi:Valine--tRNA ligase [Mycoplasmopsis californica]|uniref:Valine--tRNA ligase n=1 Tax=Mycoplasmopsis equigenitalium TaxID=114883 RepID=A0ABY5J2X8_9BACT|nr:valine--tRNA ligase [Mycoplasmopsis equigenitalium]UUD37128.1 valine--tRNA ligase [Mycoplasmopsis equigenitalium]VEU69566.1 Valine--tRNA ligase [Mycoplasmopsis californica]